MRLSRPLIASSVVLLATAAMYSIAVARPAMRSESDEVARVKIHFDSVLTALPARDLSTLTSEQIARRTALLETLRAYRARGVFPHNYDFPGQAIPYFVDRKTGTLCAVAHLLASTGRRDIVDRVARANNNVWVAQLRGDTAFTSWLDVHGLTLEEAAFIQVPYMAGPSNTEVAAMATGATIGAVAIGSAAITGLVNALANGDGHRTRMSKAGLVTGALSTAIGAGIMAQGAPAKLSGAVMAVGATSFAFAMRARQTHSAFVARQEAQRARGGVETSVAPMIDASHGGSAGLAVSMKF